MQPSDSRFSQSTNGHWLFRGIVGFWIGLAIAIFWFSARLGSQTVVVLALVWTCGFGILLRDFVASLFGPVLTYDILRTARKKRTFWFRTVYAFLMGIIFTWMYLLWRFDQNSERALIDPSRLARLAETFFNAFMFCQFALVSLITPAVVASTITDEKERRTIEFMLATDLLNREIIFGKFASRVGNILLLVLAGLPVLTMVQFFGGIDPLSVIAGFSSTIVATLSLAGVGIAASVICRKSRDAITLSNLFIVTYCAASGLAFVGANLLKRSSIFSGSILESFDWELLSYVFICGNPFYMIPEYYLNGSLGGSGRLIQGTWHFCLFHLLCFATTVTWSGYRLRSIALRQMFGADDSPRRWLKRSSVVVESSRTSTNKSNAEAKKIRSIGGSAKKMLIKPEIGDSPILWKEVFVDSGLRLGKLAKGIVFFLVLISLIPLLAIFIDIFNSYYFDIFGQKSQTLWDDLSERINIYVRVSTAIISCLLFLAISVRGAGTIIGERDRHCLDVLLTTPLPANQILWGKWWGCILGMRFGFCWLGFVWIVGITFGGLAPSVLPLLLLSTAVYAGGFAWIGIYCSSTQGTSLKATLLAIVTSIFAGGGYLLFLICCCMTPFFALIRGDTFVSVFADGIFSFSPPVNLTWLSTNKFDQFSNKLMSKEVPFIYFWAFGIMLWCLLSWHLSNLSMARFRKIANRK